MMELKDVLVLPEGGKANGVCNQALSSGLSGVTGSGLNIPDQSLFSRQMSIQSSVSSSGSLLRSERGHHRDRRRERLNTELLEAASSGDKALVQRLSEEGASVNATCRHSKKSALHAAAAKGHADVVDLLIKLGANPDARDGLGRQPVHLAAWAGQMNTLAAFAKVGNNLLSSPIQRLQNPLTEGDLDSWNHKHEELTENPDDFTEGSTPLHLVCKKSNVSCVNFLLHMGVPVDVVDVRGLTPLDVIGAKDDDISAALRGPGTHTERSRESLLPIEEDEEPPEDSGPSGSMPSFDSIPFKLPRSISKFSVKHKVFIPLADNGSKQLDANLKKNCVTSIAKSLIDKGAKMPKSQYKEGYVRNQSKTQMTALHTAVEDDNVELVTLLLERDGCMLSWNEEGETPLHVAVKNCFIEPLKVMLSYRDSPLEVIDVRNNQGRTLLQLAVMIEWADGVSLLLENGADVKTTSNFKENVFHLAAERGNSKMLEELLSVPDSIKVLNDRDYDYYSPLCKAVDNGFLDCAKLLVDSGADPNIILPGDRSLVHLCAENNFSQLLSYFLNETSAKELKDMRCRAERGGLTPLQSAAMLGYTDCVSVLLRSGCDVRLESTDEPHLSSNALHLASRNGHEEVVGLILNTDNDVLTCRDSRGWYPLHIAASNGHSKCVTTMISYGADLADYIVDEKGNYLTGLEVIIYCIPQAMEYLVQIFDSYIKTNDYPISDPNCEIRVKFDVLIPKTSSCKQLRVLTALLNCGKEKLQEKLLLHPIVQTFLHLKWRKLRIFFMIIMFFYLVFTLSLTSLAVWYYILKNETSTAIRSIHCVLFASLVPIVLAESLNVMQLQRYYLVDYESWVKWTVFACSLVVGLVDPTQWWARHLAAFTVLLAWIELLFLVARCPNWGFYVLMFSRVAMKVFKVLVTFTFLLMGFTFAFMIQFDGKDPFSTVWQSTVKVFVMMIEFDYEATFENLGDSDWLSFVSRAMFLFFVVLVAIVLMNLMIGLAVSDIAVLETQGRTQRLAKQVSFLSLLEILVGSRSALSYVPGSVRRWAENRRSVMPEVIVKAGGATMECDDTCLPRHLREAITDKVACSNQNKDNISIVSLHDIATRLDRLEQRNLNSSFSSEVSDLKDILYRQASSMQKMQYQLHQLLSSSEKLQPPHVRTKWLPSEGEKVNSDGFLFV